MYCNKHSLNNCFICPVEEQTETIVKAIEKQTADLIESQNKKQKRKADLPMLVSQLITTIVLIGAIVYIR